MFQAALVLLGLFMGPDGRVGALRQRGNEEERHHGASGD